MFRVAAAFGFLLVALSGCGGTSAPGAVGTFTINDRPCSFTSDGRQVEYVAVFDVSGSYSHRRSSTSSGATRNVEEEFKQSSGPAASIRYNYAGSLSINGKEYPIDKGRVFVIRPTGDLIECEQLPITIPPRENPLPDNAYVRGELLKAAEKEPRLAAVLGVEKK